jgi:type IV pilus biogenesis protein PilP
MYKIEPPLRLLLLAGLASVLVSAPAGAESAAEKIAKINESIAILTAQKAELELRAQIANKQAEIDKSGAGSAGYAGGAGRQASAGGHDIGLPVVRSIEGMDGRLVAMLVFSGGLMQRVKQGEKIHGDWTVADIGTHSLTLTRGREIVRLGPPN